MDHAGEHGAVCIYRAQRWFARWTAPDMVVELDSFLAHERSHRARFGAELARRGRRRCRSHLVCGLGGFVLAAFTGLFGRRPIAATTVAIETVVLRHMREQIEVLRGQDAAAAVALSDVIADEEAHHDLSQAWLAPPGLWPRQRLSAAMLFEKGAARFAGAFPELEDGLCALTRGGFAGPRGSPDRADALVWAMTELMLGRKRQPVRVSHL